MDVLFKYVPAERVLRCLPKVGNGTLRATQPSSLNDPFECSVSRLFRDQDEGKASERVAGPTPALGAGGLVGVGHHRRCPGHSSSGISSVRPPYSRHHDQGTGIRKRRGLTCLACTRIRVQRGSTRDTSVAGVAAATGKGGMVGVSQYRRLRCRWLCCVKGDRIPIWGNIRCDSADSAGRDQCGVRTGVWSDHWSCADVAPEPPSERRRRHFHINGAHR